jgi:hypothetical protein
MPHEWGGVFVCPYFGCGVVVASEAKLDEHSAAHYGAAPGAVSFPNPSATQVVDPALLERAPAVRDAHALTQDGVAAFDLTVRVDSSCRGCLAHTLSQTLRVGSTVTESVFRGHLTLSVNVLTGHLRIRQRMRVGSPPLQVEVTTLGVEDVLLWSNRANESIVELVIRLRAPVFSGPWDPDDASDSRMLVLMRMDEVVANSLLFCLSSNLVDDVSVTPEDAAPQTRHEHNTMMVADLRKAFMRRDLLNRGWTDESLQTNRQLWQLLGRTESHKWEEQHQQSGSNALAADAPQLRLHARMINGADNNQTPNPNLAPPRPPTVTLSSNGAAAAIAAATGAPSVAPPSPPNSSSWHVSRAALSQPSIALLTSPLFAAAAAARAEEAMPAGPAMPVYKPKTAYQLYHKYTVAELKRQDPTIKHQQAFKKAGQMWSEMSLAEQAVWKAKADVVPKRKVKKLKVGPRVSLQGSDGADEFL